MPRSRRPKRKPSAPTARPQNLQFPLKPTPRPAPAPPPNAPKARRRGLTLHASADEVAIFFAATDHGKSVTNLTGGDVGIRDDRKPPAAITGFRNEAQLPLRLALVIDTSDSIAGRFKFEQDAAANFMQKVVTGPVISLSWSASPTRFS